MTRILFTLLLFTYGVLPVTAQVAPAEGTLDTVEARLNFAATQHEIITILLETGRYDEVFPEYQKILSLNLSGELETLLVKEAWLIVDDLLPARNFSLAHRIVETTLQTVEDPQSRFSLLMFRGKIFKEEGRLQDAIQTYRQAQDLPEKR